MVIRQYFDQISPISGLVIIENFFTGCPFPFYIMVFLPPFYDISTGNRNVVERMDFQYM
jgi:predicted deacetylase